MLAQGLISWWYTDGYKLFVGKLFSKLGDTIDLFSIGSLLKTLFAPYRQIAANETGVSVDDKIIAFIDRLVSRFVGGVARLGIVIAGILVILLQFVGSIIMFVVWPLLPLTPILFIVLAVMGVSL
jgi:hypothetical protein